MYLGGKLTIKMWEISFHLSIITTTPHLTFQVKKYYQSVQFNLTPSSFLNSIPKPQNHIKMQAFITLVATFATLGAVSGSPITHLLPRDTCGSTPTASGSQAPIQQSTDMKTASACQTACNADGQCQSFVFGMVDNTIKCILFSVPASQVPAQSSQNLVAFDKACTSVPTVTPTSSNPTGASSGQGSNSNNNQQGQQGQQTQQGGNNPAGQKLAVRDTCGATPAGTNSNQAALSEPANIDSAADCLEKCKDDSNCKSFEFGPENGANVCRLFSVAASNVPAPTNGQSFQVYDAGCSV
jgi:hypothetical protein